MKALSALVDIVLLPAIFLSLGLAFLYAPSDMTMHDVYRIFYFHVPATASAGFGITIVFVCSVLYLRTRDLRYDIVASAAAELAIVFATLGISMGMLWAKPIWGAYWIPGDIHLMTTAIVYLIYLAYLMLRGAIEDEERRARVSAVVGIFGFAGIPIVYFSIRVVQVGNHPVLLGLDARMQFTFMVCMNSMLLLFTFLLLRRVRLEFASADVARLRRELLALTESAEVSQIVAGAEVAPKHMMTGTA